MSDLSKLRGLKTLLVESVENGSRAIEGVHLATAARSFTLVGALVGPTADPIKTAYDAWVSHTYTQVREVTQVVSGALDAALDAADGRG